MKNLQGSIVALVTPMLGDGSIDWRALERLIEWHINQASSGLIILGTTAESATLTAKEKLDIINLAIKTINGRIPLIVGSGSNCTATAVANCKKYNNLGLTASLQITPYYNRPNQSGIIKHFEKIAAASDIPIILYDVPLRTGVELELDTISELFNNKAIIGLKEASGDIAKVAAIAKLDKDILLFSGDDKTCGQAMAKGYVVGCMSVVANVIPKQFSEYCNSMLNGTCDKKLALNIEQLISTLECDSNPIPIKYALAHINKIANGIRLPLDWLNSAKMPAIKQALKLFE